MKDIRIIQGSSVQNLITKFYYREQKLCFQILLHLGLDQTIPYQEFSDYSLYKQVYNKLLDQKNANAAIEVQVKSIKKSSTAAL